MEKEIIYKICSKCKQEKETSDFQKDSQKRDGLSSSCRQCRRIVSKNYKINNPDKYKESIRRFKENNREALRAKGREYYQNNIEKEKARARIRYSNESPEIRRERDRRWKRNNPEKVKLTNRRMSPFRKKRIRRATPPWLTKEQREEIRNIYKQRENRSMRDGIDYHVDHIEPLAGRTASGLHVPWNLEIIPALENRIKSNKELKTLK